MRVRVTPPDVVQSETPPIQESLPSLNSLSDEIQEIPGDAGPDTIPPEDVPSFHDGTPEVIDYSNGSLLTILSYIIWGVIFIANVYAIVMLFMGVNSRG